MGSVAQQMQERFRAVPWRRVATISAAGASVVAADKLAASSVLGSVLGIGGAVAIEYGKRRYGLRGYEDVQAGLAIGGAICAVRGLFGSSAPTDWDSILYEDRFTYCTRAEREARTASGLREPSEWLNPEAEICGNASSFSGQQQFSVDLMDRLLRLGVSLEQALTVTAHLALETGFGRSFNGNNLGGVTVTRAWAENYKRVTGRDAPFWRARGHVGQGDSPTMFFRAYPSIDAFLVEFLRTFAPRPGTSPGSRYRRAGDAFWSGGDWFRELLAAGYRGEVTQANPEPSIARHRGLEATIRRIYTGSVAPAGRLVPSLGAVSYGGPGVVLR